MTYQTDDDHQDEMDDLQARLYRILGSDLGVRKLSGARRIQRHTTCIPVMCKMCVFLLRTRPTVLQCQATSSTRWWVGGPGHYTVISIPHSPFPIPHFLVPSPQSPVSSLQSPVPSPHSAVPNPQSPFRSPQSQSPIPVPVA